VSGAEDPGLSRTAPVNAPFDGAEQLALEQVRRQRGAVDRAETALGARATARGSRARSAPCPSRWARAPSTPTSRAAARSTTVERALHRRIAGPHAVEQHGGSTAPAAARGPASTRSSSQALAIALDRRGATCTVRNRPPSGPVRSTRSSIARHCASASAIGRRLGVAAQHLDDRVAGGDRAGEQALGVAVTWSTRSLASRSRSPPRRLERRGEDAIERRKCATGRHCQAIHAASTGSRGRSPPPPVLRSGPW